jgi:acyl carrier protein
MNREEVAARVRSFVEQLAQSSAFSNEDHLLDAGVLHSIHIVELILFVADGFGVTLAADDIYDGRLASIHAIVDLVSSRMAA